MSQQQKTPPDKMPALRIMHIISGDLWAGAEVQAYTLLKQLHQEHQLLVVLMNPGQLADQLNALGIPLEIIDEQQCSSLQIIGRLRRAMQKFKPDIVHTHRQKENILGSLANFFSVRAKSLRTSHGAPEFKPKGKQRIQVWLDQWAGRYLQQAIISVSQDLTEKLAKIFPRKKIHLILNGVDVDQLNTAAQIADFRKEFPKHKHIGIIGRIEPVKRVDIFIAMANILLKNESQIPMKFHVIGDGSLRKNLEAQVANQALNADIIFHGHRKDTASCIQSLNAVIMCSDHEGTPMTALEVVALGKPLIAHAVGGLKEILRGYPQLQVTDHSAQAYASCLLKSLLDKTQVELPLSYTSVNNAANTVKLYRTLLSK